jgi:serine/threonine protein kinase
MAPERVEGREALPASDLWSLGATLFFAVEGTVPFERATTAATLHAIMTEIPYLTRGHGPLAAAILGLLVASPDARLSAAQAQHLLATAQGTRPTPPQGTRITQPPARSRRPLWLSLAAVLVAGALAGGFFAGRAYERPAVDTQQRETVTYGVDGYLKIDDNLEYNRCYNTGIQQNIVIGADNRADTCAKLHTLEIYDIVPVLPTTSYSDSDAVIAQYPDFAALKAAAEARCAESFRSSAVPADKRADLVYRAIVPTSAEWNLRPADNDTPSRDFYCVLARADGGPISAPIVTKVK